ncbi:MAG: undecaprenyl-diphosphate phosphatase, partial [Planctomycetota bacterium]
MTLLEIIIMGVVQGVTEFLPVSSSGHLVVANALLESFGGSPVEDLVEVNVVLHLGTLGAVLVYYRREIARLLTSDQRVVPLLVVGTIPAAVLGVWIKKGIPDETSAAILENPLLAGLMFPVTAAALVWASRQKAGDLTYQQLSVKQTLIIGTLQAFALLPGISRSGATIAGGLGVGLRREDAAAFAFLLAIPAISGAGALELLEMLETYQATGATATPLATLAVGFVISMVVGLGALSLLIQFVRRGQLNIFAYYLVALGLAVTAWQLSS